MIKTFSKFYIAPLLLVVLATAQIQAKKETQIKGKRQTIFDISTHQENVECKLELLSKSDAKELLGSTASLNGNPKDEFTTTSNTNGASYNVAWGIELSNAQTTSNQILKNGFENLHNRYLVGRVTIKNNSTKDITITNPLMTGEDYLSFKGIELTPPGEILERYNIPSTFERFLFKVGAGTTAGLTLLTLYAMNKIHPRAPIGAQILTGLTGCGFTAYFIHEINKIAQRIETKKHFVALRTCIDGEPAENLQDNEITIPAGSTFTDFIFINKETYKTPDQLIANAEGKITCEEA